MAVVGTILYLFNCNQLIAKVFVFSLLEVMKNNSIRDNKRTKYEKCATKNEISRSSHIDNQKSLFLENW